MGIEPTSEAWGANFEARKRINWRPVILLTVIVPWLARNLDMELANAAH
jgi:hypothetical protein